MFQDREDAARQLATRLAAYRGKHPLVLAVPRGAVPMGKILAERLQGELDVVLVRKLRAPYHHELAIGAVDESGWTTIAPHAASTGADQDYIAEEKHHQLQVLRSRRVLYSPLRTPVDPAGRTVIVVDDGLATGATMTAALHGLRQRHPLWLVCAVPVASSEALNHIRPMADEVICLLTPPDFQAVGQFYRDFPQVTDDEVIALLKTLRPITAQA
jgi:putative phosphoribosyl transferase